MSTGEKRHYYGGDPSATVQFYDEDGKPSICQVIRKPAGELGTLVHEAIEAGGTVIARTPEYQAGK